MLKKMSVNNFEERLQFNDVRNIIKKEIWKQAMSEVKQLKSRIQTTWQDNCYFIIDLIRRIKGRGKTTFHK
jgi:hypothetical protein